MPKKDVSDHGSGTRGTDEASENEYPSWGWKRTRGRIEKVVVEKNETGKIGSFATWPQ